MGQDKRKTGEKQLWHLAPSTNTSEGDPMSMVFEGDMQLTSSLADGSFPGRETC